MKYQTEIEMQRGTLLREGRYRSIRDMLDRLSRLKPDAPILQELNEKEEKVTWTARALKEEVMCLGEGLLAAGLQGAHIAIVSGNCCRYILADLCVSNGVGVVTPIDANAPADLLALLLNKCDATALFCDPVTIPKVRSVREACPSLKTLILLSGQAEDVLTYDELLEKGRSVGENGPYHTMTPDPDAPAKILFTSGTTGINKGVVLTGANLTANMNNCQDVVEAWEDHNVSMSVLPMHHSAEINTHIMTRIGCGRLTCICPDVRRMMPSLKIFQPSTITVVPMIAQAFYKSIWAGARKNGKAEKLAKGIRLANLLRKFGFEISHKLFPEVFAPFGGHLKMIICGGAMVNPVVVKGMADLGIRIENGYGITECGPLISMNADPRKEHLSVGKPCPNLETRIDQPDENGVGELCVRGRNVSSGYYKDPEATALVFDPDGWFHTGDMARIAADGRIFLMGRLKNTIVLSNGKNVNPEELENLIETRLEYVDECVVYPARLEKGDQEFIVAGLYISDESRRADRSAVAADVAALNATLSSYKRLEYVELPATDYPKNAMRKILRKGLPTVISEGALEIV